MLCYYCLYPVILAMNGTSEAFLHAVADKQQIQQSNNFLVACSVVYVVLNVLLIQSIGVVGSVVANSINMIMRILYSSLFIKYYFQRELLDDSSDSFLHWSSVPGYVLISDVRVFFLDIISPSECQKM